ncbi:MAG: hypothetical protein KAS04_01535 [Candidatus Aenigmarchaeota archaeon]|nr:hypothetical protein [Candidatus Aenigmarchaeota archaeon]
MNIKQAFVLFSVFFSCYLIMSIIFVSAYTVGEVFNTDSAKFVIEPVLKIIDELEPIDCDTGGYMTFRAYVDNIPEFDIDTVDALVEDKSTGIYYNITSAVSCFPFENVLSNQEINCRIKVKEMLSLMPSCPFEQIKNDFYLTLGISYVNREAKVTAEKDIIITKAGTEPHMEINFNVASPPYPVPQINCLTGSEFDVPVLIEHAEKLSGDISWSFSLNGVSYGGGLINCEELLERQGNGIEKIYICELTVSNNAFTECDVTKDAFVSITAKNGDYELSSDFTTSFISEPLDLSLRVTGLDDIECQIVSEEGLCIPLEPQQNITVTITGNVPQKIEVFETRYMLDNGEITTAYCKKLAYNKYKCSTFVPLANVELPANKGETTSMTRKVTAFFDLKYINYYTNVSDSETFVMEGKMIQELINTIKVLKKDVKHFEWITNFTSSETYAKVWDWINMLRKCCKIGDIVNTLEEKGFKKGVHDLGEKYIWGEEGTKLFPKILKIFNFAYELLVGNGPKMLECVSGKAMKEVEDEIQKLEDFEDGAIVAEIKIPTLLEMMGDHFASCRAEIMWEQYSDLRLWICVVLRVVFKSVGDVACKILDSGIMKAIDKILTFVHLLLLIDTYNQAQKDMALSMERMNLQLTASNIMSEYTEKLSATMESLSVSISTNAALYNITYGDYRTVKLIFLSDRTGVLANGDDICSGDEITIDYDFEKLNQTEGFVSELDISSDTHFKTLIFGELKGTYGPTKTDALLGTDPSNDLSETYTFTLNYEDKSLDYNLEYVNSPCS